MNALASPRLPDQPVVAVVGATGLVGEVLLSVLDARAFPVRELVPLAGPRSAGSELLFGGRPCVVRDASTFDFEGVDLVFFAATGELSRTLAPRAREAGALVIDKSATWRLDPEVPLVVPEINAAALAGSGPAIVACPNCTTIGMVMALEPLRRAAGLERVVVTTFQAASGAGRDGLDALAREAAIPPPSADAPRRVTKDSPFVAPLAHNVVPLCDAREDDGATREEHKLLDETRKILGLPELSVVATCVRVPVPVGHGASLFVETSEPLDSTDAEAALAAFPGVEVREHPTPEDVRGTDAVLVGRVRRAPGGGLLLWQVADNLRKGAATNAVQIAEALLPR